MILKYTKDVRNDVNQKRAFLSKNKRKISFAILPELPTATRAWLPVGPLPGRIEGYCRVHMSLTEFWAEGPGTEFVCGPSLSIP